MSAGLQTIFVGKSDPRNGCRWYRRLGLIAVCNKYITSIYLHFAELRFRTDSFG